MSIMKIIAKIVFLFLFTNHIYAQVVIGTGTAHPSAQFQINSTDKGLLPPRMRQVERDDIENPTAGLCIWCSDCTNRKKIGATDDNSVGNVESLGQMQVFNGQTWTNIYGGEALEAAPSVSLQNSSVSLSGSAEIFKPCSFLATINYKNGNGRPYATNPTNFYSNNVIGLVANLVTTSGTLKRGSGEIVFQIQGMPITYGNASFTIDFLDSSYTFQFPILERNLTVGEIIDLHNNVKIPFNDFGYTWKRTQDYLGTYFDRNAALDYVAAQVVYLSSPSHGYIRGYSDVDNSTNIQMGRTFFSIQWNLPTLAEAAQIYPSRIFYGDYWVGGIGANTQGSPPKGNLYDFSKNKFYNLEESSKSHSFFFIYRF